MIAQLLILAGLVMAATPQAAEPSRTDGLVAEVQLVDATPLGADAMLLLLLDDGRPFLVPDQRNLAVSSGMEVSVTYLPAAEGEVPVACQVKVIAVPVIIAGEERLQTAQRPFSVYRNRSEPCSNP